MKTIKHKTDGTLKRKLDKEASTMVATGIWEYVANQPGRKRHVMLRPEENETVVAPRTRKTFVVKVCPQCRLVYELVPDHYTKRDSVLYHEDFPPYGLHRKICLKCQPVEA